jgi:hypothetical protein
MRIQLCPHKGVQQNYSLVFVVFMLLCLSSNAVAQTQQAAQEGPYYNLSKDVSGVTTYSAWYAQPWIWAIVAALLILFIGMVFKNNRKRDVESEDSL